MRRLKRSLLLPAAAAMALAMAAAGCAQSDRDGGDASERNESDPFIFAGASNPRSMDPVFASDGETFRVSRQISEALLRHEPGGTELEGALAEDWDHNDEGTEWTFNLRDDVTFHDGDEFNAEAVCANYDRWNETTGIAQSSSVMYYWNALFDGFAENEDDDMPDSNYVGCEAEDEYTVTIEIAEYSARYPGAFSMAALGILSPSTIEEVPDDPVGGDSEDPSLPEYALEGGTVAGTGPYELVDWDHGAEEVQMERFDDYWGETANIREMIIKTIDDETARRQALEAGDIHGYDLVAPADVDPLEEAGLNVPERDVFNVLYLAMVGDERIEDDHPDRADEAEALADPDVRTAIAHAVDRQRIVDTILPPGGEVATQFIPDTLDGFSEDVTTYDYDPDLAREMLEDAGYEDGDLELEFCWPTDTTRPYMPAPQDIFNVVSNDLEEVGISLTENGLIWDDYIPYTEDGACSLYLLGWTGDYNESYNFLGTWFAGYSSAWRFEDDDVFDTLEAVNAEPEDEPRIELYEEANEAIMDYLPGLPLSSSPPSIAFAEDIDPPTVSPLTQEDFAETSWAE